jgi:hypothetical protein
MLDDIYQKQMIFNQSRWCSFEPEWHTAIFFVRNLFKNDQMRGLIPATDFGQISFKLVEIRPIVGFLCANLSVT